MARWITSRLIAARYWLLGAAILLALLAYWPAQRLAFDRRIENMFAADDPLLPPYALLKRTFGGNEVVMAVYRDADLMSEEGLARLGEVAARLEQVPGVAEVLSWKTPYDVAQELESEQITKAFRALFEGYTHSADGTVAAVVCMLLPEDQTEAPRRETVERLRAIISQQPQGTVTGEPVMVVDGFRYIEDDGARLGWTSSLLLMATIALCFRSLRWVMIPLAVVQLTLLLTRAALVLLRLQLSMVSSMLTAIVTVVGVATVVHIIVRFRDASHQGLEARGALLTAGTILAAPIFWACTTDAVGFASLLSAGVGPIRDFGVMMATGSLLVILSVALLVPGLALLGPVEDVPRRAWGEAGLDRALRRALDWVELRPRLLLTLVFLIAAACSAGAYRLRVETDFTKNFRATSPIVQSYQFVESELGGAGVWDVVLPAPEQLTWTYIEKVLHLEQRLRREVPELTKVLSLADAIQAASPLPIGNLPTRPFNLQRSALSVAKSKMEAQMPVFTKALYGEDPESAAGQHYLRIMLRARERQPAEQKKRIIDQVEAISKQEFAKLRQAFPDAFDENDRPRATGFFVLLTGLIGSMIRDQWVTFGVATLGIGMMMMIAFRSIPLALVALVPNALPILIVTGLMGWSGLKINMGAAMIAAVSLGLSIDSSIHYITEFRRARADGLDISAALDRVQQSVGRALFFATLALIVGFMSLLTSQFVPTIYFGALVSLTMLGGLLGNLLVLPLLLRTVTRDTADSSRSS